MIEIRAKGNMNELTKFDASNFFQNCNQIEMFFENAYEQLQFLEDGHLTDLYSYLSIISKHSWKMQCAILAEAQQRVKKRGGRKKEMEKVAGEFGIRRTSMFSKAQVWNKFFQNDDKESISPGAWTYRFDHFLDGYTWFQEALSADDPQKAIAYAEKQYDELEGKYSTRDFRKDIKRHFKSIIKSDWLKVDDVWNFTECEAGYGTEGYTGRIPAQIVKNVVYYWTNEHDVIVDPMVGGGTSYDVCREMKRKCYGLDIKPIRDEFIEWDITKGYPDNIEQANLVFLDPPYFKKKAKEYKLPEELLTKKGFMDFARSWVRFCEGALIDKGIVALLISDYVDYDNAAESIFSYEYATLFTNYDMLYKISCPLTTEQYQAFDVVRAKEQKTLLIRGRELYIMRKNHGEIS